MDFQRAFAIAVALLASRASALADTCQQPVYRGLGNGAVMRFLGKTGEMIEHEHGTIETVSPKHAFQFTTAHSNGFGREYLTLDGFPVDSVVMRKKADFTSAQGPTPFLLTPDLVMKYYYATNQAGQEALHAVRLDDTWKLIGCGKARL